MKVRLLNNGSYNGMDSVSFPVEVEVESSWGSWVRVAGHQLKAAGADSEYFKDDAAYIFCQRPVDEHDEFEFTQGDGK